MTSLQRPPLLQSAPTSVSSTLSVLVHRAGGVLHNPVSGACSLTTHQDAEVLTLGQVQSSAMRCARCDWYPLLVRRPGDIEWMSEDELFVALELSEAISSWKMTNDSLAGYRRFCELVERIRAFPAGILPVSLRAAHDSFADRIEEVVDALTGSLEERYHRELIVTTTHELSLLALQLRENGALVAAEMLEIETANIRTSMVLTRWSIILWNNGNPIPVRTLVLRRAAERYRLKPELYALPGAIHLALTHAGVSGVSESLTLTEPPTRAVLEAVSALYDPMGDGAYTELEDALAAAEAL